MPDSAASRMNAESLSASAMPPHSIEAEQSVLGGLMLDNQTWDNVTELIVIDDFYRHDHRLIYKTMCMLAENNQPLDVITLSEALSNENKLDTIGGLAYLLDLAKNTPSAANVEAYAKIVRERSIYRQLIGAANKISLSAFNPEGRESSELLDEAESLIFSIAEKGQADGGPIAIQQLLADAVQRIDRLFRDTSTITGLPSGFGELDELTSGFHPADLVIIAGRPSMGKTTFAMNIVENALIKQNKTVLFFSLEMPADGIVTRMLSSLSNIDQSSLRVGKIVGDDWHRLTSGISMLSETKLFIDESAGLNPTEMRARARRVKREQGELDLIVVDYLQLMQGTVNRDNRVAEISEISRSLKLLGKELGVPVIALSQLNREVEHRQEKRPVMADLRESGAIEQDADLIAFIYRDEVYNKDTESKGIAEIIIAKQRNGPIGTVHLKFQGQFCRFEDIQV